MVSTKYHTGDFYQMCLELASTIKEETTMSFNINEPFIVGSAYYGNSFSNIEDALRNAREKSTSDRKDVAIYKAVQIVKFPEIKAEDLKVEKLS